MEQKLETKLEFKDKLNNLYNIHKGKLFIITLILIIAFAIVIYINQRNERNNNLIAEKYVQANLSFSLNKKDEAINLFNEIILTKNKFYSILAFNNLLEKNLINENEQILNYFDILENLDLTEEEEDLIIFKKALYFYKISKNEEGKILFESLIKKDSKLKLLAQEIILK